MLLLVLMEKSKASMELEEFARGLNVGRKPVRRSTDMKVSGGMTEAEAIEDFGDFNEFVREVLNAYHVKAPFDQEDAVEAAATASPTAGDRLDDAVRGGAQAAGRAVDATKRGARKMASAVTGAAGKFSDRAKEAVSQASAARAEARAEAAASGVEADRDGSESRAAAASGTSRGMIAEVGGMARSFGGVCWNVAKTAARWCWNFAVACLMAVERWSQTGPAFNENRPEAVCRRMVGAAGFEPARAMPSAF